MSCKKCNKKVCGCEDTPFTTPPAYIGTIFQECAENMYTGCVIYNGPELTEINIVPGMNLNQIIQALVLFDTNEPCITSTCQSTFVYVKSTGRTTIDIGWALVPEVVTYTVSYMEEDLSPAVWTTQDVGPTSSHLVLTGLICGTTYLLKVTANCASSSCDSVTIRVTTSDC